MEKEPRFRILNKTSKTVTVKLQGKPMTFSWEEFNKKLVVVDDVWAVLNEEEKKKQEEIEELINMAVVCIFTQNGNASAHDKLVSLARLGSITKELQEMMECSNVEVLNIIKKRLNIFTKSLHVFNGRHKTQEEKPTFHTDENKTTFADACPGLAELKEKMEKE